MKKLAGKILLLINILFALILLLSYTAPVINPAIILFPAFLGLAYPYLVLINMVFLVYWTIRFRKELLISLVVILIGWGHLMNLIPLNFGEGSGSKNLPESNLIGLMSYNVRTFDQYNWSQQDNSFDGIFDVIKNQSPDILCFQEFYTVNKTGRRERDVKKYLEEYSHYFIYYSLESGPNSGFGIALFSKYPIIKTSRIPFDQSMNQAIYADLQLDQDTVRVFNIHLQSIRFGQNNYSFIDSLSLKYSNRQLEEVKDIGKRLRDAFVLRAEQSRIIHRYILDSPYPVIVMGDFNDTPISYAYHRIQKGLTDTFSKAGSGLGNTYAGDLPSYRIDFIFCSKELEPVSFKRIKSKYSDHFPITSSLKWHDSAAVK
ncbi:MAG: endonuclease/exonuclease/phosphatase family protein [Bacteroidales bacterium]|nr:endonuclease/exonuclease/phosphatase family protein [Bacteroidales bacterium]